MCNCDNKKTCFVITGFGSKSDPNKPGRIIDLDKTFEHLIKPVFDELKIKCFRAREIRHTGIIDVPMYEWIFKADIVVADVSILNPNALYELGVRHALRPNTTIVIAEDQTKYPFDINHTLITKYEHLGKDIGVSEATRFKDELKMMIVQILEEAKTDSPVYTYLPNLIPPKFSESELDSIIEKPNNQVSFSELLKSAEQANNNKEFNLAKELYKVCLKFAPQNIFIIQQLALATYRSCKPDPKKALIDSENILKNLRQEDTINVETLRLLGTINKKRYELTNKLKYLDKSIKYFTKGFYIGEDHYSGINFAILLILKANIQEDKVDALILYGQSILISQEVVDICNNLKKQKDLGSEIDKEGIAQSLAFAYLILEKNSEFDKTVSVLDQQSQYPLIAETFEEYSEKLIRSLIVIRKLNNQR